MPAGKCRICDNASTALFVNTLLDKGISNAGIAKSIMELGGDLDADIIGRHKNRHWTKPEPASGPKATKGDLALLVRDKTYEMVEDLSPDAMLLMGKDLAPIVGKGLNAQALIDKREQLDKKLGIQAGAIALQAWIAGLGRSEPPPELDDGNTIEGQFTDG